MTSNSPIGLEGSDLSSINTMMSAVMNSVKMQSLKPSATEHIDQNQAGDHGGRPQGHHDGVWLQEGAHHARYSTPAMSAITCLPFSGGLLHMHLHLGISPYQCFICDYMVAEKAELICHLCMHSSEWPNICKICHYPFTIMANSQRHLGKRHLKGMCKDIEKNIDYVSSSVADLVDVVCWLCGEDLKHYCALCIHMLTHCGCGLGGCHKTHKLFQCKECSIAFVAKCNCIHHILKQHLARSKQHIESHMLTMHGPGNTEASAEEWPLATASPSLPSCSPKMAFFMGAPPSCPLPTWQSSWSRPAALQGTSDAGLFLEGPGAGASEEGECVLPEPFFPGPLQLLHGVHRPVHPQELQERRQGCSCSWTTKVADPGLLSSSGSSVAAMDSLGGAIPRATATPSDTGSLKECGNQSPMPSSPEVAFPTEQGTAGSSKKTESQEGSEKPALCQPRPEDDAQEEAAGGHTDHHGSSDEEQGRSPENRLLRAKWNFYTNCLQKINCPHCSWVFPWASSLQRHMLTHTDSQSNSEMSWAGEGKTTKCQGGERPLTLKGSLVRHPQIHQIPAREAPRKGQGQGKAGRGGQGGPVHAQRNNGASEDEAEVVPGTRDHAAVTRSRKGCGSHKKKEKEQGSPREPSPESPAALVQDLLELCGKRQAQPVLAAHGTSQLLGLE
ncbi:Ras-responsive element-binding protein 1 [Heterocephalus glaber]|uniref:Ras-responsive element-binding protein 1 n=1 Tax=Heterocephalus glaber TaxID=10181 RepID=G5BYR3_HETGA|nr:Ras-responsive element-binding protein 1 [Heterocephalus glaber]